MRQVAVPVIMELAFAKDFELATSGPLDGYVPTPWGVDGKLVVQRGWGFAILNPVSYQKDDGSGLTEGIIGLANQGQPRKLDDWGVLKAWAWGAEQARHYFEMDKAVDAKQVGLVGHSRFGKAVLVTMAYEYREFAVGYISSSGEGGAKLYRHIYGEQIPNLASASLYHWFDGNFLRYAGPSQCGRSAGGQSRTDCAVRSDASVYRGRSGYGRWLCESEWRRMGGSAGDVSGGGRGRAGLPDDGCEGFGNDGFSGDGNGVDDRATLAFRQHDGGHTPQPNWPYFLEFASRYLHAPGERAH